MSDPTQGTVKWFSNKKGFGFITPLEGQAVDEDVFVHQSSVTSDGFRTLSEGWRVEFSVGRDENGRPKADHVTAVGGGPCTGPRPSSSRSKPRSRAAHKKDEKVPRIYWHHRLDDEVKDSLQGKGIRMSTGTIDIALDQWRIKLGNDGYSSCAHADKTLAEGEYVCSENGMVEFAWGHCISFIGGEWISKDSNDMFTSLSLLGDDIKMVPVNESPENLWGGDFTDPLNALEANGFKMRRVVLTTKLQN